MKLALLILVPLATQGNVSPAQLAQPPWFGAPANVSGSAAPNHLEKMPPAVPVASSSSGDELLGAWKARGRSVKIKVRKQGSNYVADIIEGEKPGDAGRQLFDVAHDSERNKWFGTATPPRVPGRLKATIELDQPKAFTMNGCWGLMCKRITFDRE